MTHGAEDEAKAIYLAAGMTEIEYDVFESLVALRLTLEDGGFDELATPLRIIVLMIDRWTERERQRARIVAEAAEDFKP